jgi:NADH:ubiquinone oxidoreductase subunit D
MFTSAELVFSCATFLAGNSKVLNIPTSCYIDFPDNKIVFPNRSLMKNNMESLITHFKLFSEGISLEDVFFYAAVEAPKGELGVFVEFNDGPRPIRCKIRSPGYYHLQALDWMSRDHLIADLVAIIGTQDIVFGEVDR